MNASSLILVVIAIFAQSGEPTRRAPGNSPFIARTVAILEGRPEDPMRLPTGVAVASSGRVFVADGVSDRIVEFDAEGTLLGSFNRVGTENLSRPMSLKVDAEENLWIVDTGHERVLVRKQDGNLVRTISVPGPVDLTDIALVGATTAWLVDNGLHRLIRHDLTSGVFEHFGHVGEGRGQFHHPFLIASDANGVVYVSDSINRRVMAIRDVNILPREFGSSGVEPGQFHRPKGVAVDSAGRVIVVDGSLGVVQYFASDGKFLDALRDESGAVMRFESPCGIAAFEQVLYVTEMMPGHIRKLTIETREVKRDFTPPPRKSAPHHSQPNTCTVCHLEWMPHFNTNTPTELSPPPASRPNEPYVGSEFSCLSCHDGSVVDSRRKVWLEHGHRTGVTPKPDMAVPAELPLVDGKLACRTCHSAHTRGGAGQTMADAVFLRVQTNPDELCVRCHARYKGENLSGSHPTEGFSKPLHPDLISAGAKFSFDAPSTGCLVCHTGHGSRQKRLLVATPTADRMCLSCHPQMTMLPGDSDTSTHPLNASLTTQQQRILETLGSTSTPEGQLQCISCHKMHQAPGAENLLVRTQEGSRLCVECHSTYAAVFDSAHNLSRAQESELSDCKPNGPCSACHGVHNAPRPAVVTAVDKEGACVTCHRTDSCAQSRTGNRFLHPVEIPQDLLNQLNAFTGRAARAAQYPQSLTCLSCHDPHGESKTQAMLRSPAAADPASLCFECHAEMRPIEASFHGQAALAGTMSQQTQCDACHAIHAPTPVWDGGSWVAPIGTDALSVGSHHCTGCHSAAAGRHDISFKPHPQIALSNVIPADQPGYMPLVDSSGKPAAHGSVGCITCHMPHGRAAGRGFTPPDSALTPEPLIHASKSMLRPYVAPNLCSSCHASDGLYLFLYFHVNAHADSKNPETRHRR